MTCRKDAGGCDYQFCWLCRGPWAEHGSATGGYYGEGEKIILFKRVHVVSPACNKYDASAAKKDDMQADQVKVVEGCVWFFCAFFFFRFLLD
jgi:hypothetical protein